MPDTNNLKSGPIVSQGGKIDQGERKYETVSHMTKSSGVREVRKGKTPRRRKLICTKLKIMR